MSQLPPPLPPPTDEPARVLLEPGALRLDRRRTRRRWALIVAALALLFAGGVAAFVLLRGGKPSVASDDARRAFDRAFAAIDAGEEGAELPGCPRDSVDETFSRFIRAAEVPLLYDPLEFGIVQSSVVFEADVDRAVMYCSVDATRNLARMDGAFNELGMFITPAPNDGFESFTRRLTARNEPPEPRFENLGKELGGTLHLMVKPSDDQPQAEFQEIAWIDDELLVVFVVRGREALDIDPETLRRALVSILPDLVDNVEGAEPFEPVNPAN